MPSFLINSPEIQITYFNNNTNSLFFKNSEDFNKGIGNTDSRRSTIIKKYQTKHNLCT